MFADIDGGFLRVYVDHKGRQIPMVLPLSLKKFENRFLVFPSDHNLKKLAHQVSLKRYWQKDQEVIEEMKRPGFLLPGPASFYHDAHEIKLNSLIVEYWKYHFDFKSGKVKANRVKRKVYSFENIKLAKNKL